MVMIGGLPEAAAAPSGREMTGSSQKLAWAFLLATCGLILGGALKVANMAGRQDFAQIDSVADRLEWGEALLPASKTGCYVLNGKAKAVFFANRTLATTALRSMIIDRPAQSYPAESLGTVPVYMALAKDDCAHFATEAFNSGWAVRNAAEAKAHAPQAAAIAKAIRERKKTALPGSVAYLADPQ